VLLVNGVKYVILSHLWTKVAEPMGIDDIRFMDTFQRMDTPQVKPASKMMMATLKDLKICSPHASKATLLSTKSAR
jgi:hypothetical protein